MNTPGRPDDILRIPAGPRYAVPLRWLPATQARANLVLMAALGVPARFYLPLATALRDQGLNVALVEQRGHGDSPLRASRRVDFGFREALQEDIPAVLDWLPSQAPSLRTFLMGHSLGGHYAAMTAGRLPTRVDGVILAACGTPWVEAFEGKTRRQLQLLVRLVPLFNLLLGYYPGDRVGFGGREARTLMRDWLVMARINAYRAQGLDADLDAGIARYTGPVLSLRLADDDFAPEASMRAITDKFRAAQVTHAVIGSNELGDRADHFRWARTPAAVVRHIDTWLPTST